MNNTVLSDLFVKTSGPSIVVQVDFDSRCPDDPGAVNIGRLAMKDIDNFDVIASDRGVAILLSYDGEPVGDSPVLVIDVNQRKAALFRTDTEQLVLHEIPPALCSREASKGFVVIAEIDEITARQAIADGRTAADAICREYRVQPKFEELVESLSGGETASETRSQLHF